MPCEHRLFSGHKVVIEQCLSVQQRLGGRKEAICLQNVRKIKIQIQHRPVLKRRKKAHPAIQAVQKAAHHPVLPVPLPAQVPVRHRLHLLRQLK